MQRTVGIPDEDFKRFKGFTVKFLLRDAVLYWCKTTGMPPRMVLGNTKDEEEVLRKLHDEWSHQEVDEIYEKERLHYYWDVL